MRLLDRYIGRQLFVTSLFAIVVLSAVLVLGNVFKQLLEQVVNKNAPPALIFSFIEYVIPFSLTFTLPWGFLTAVLLVFGRLSADNELTAMRTSGISIPRISLPVGILAAIFTCVCLWINLDVAPRAQEAMKSAITNIATSNPLSFFQSDHIISEIPSYKIYVEQVEATTNGAGNKLHKLHIYKTDDDGGLMFVMFVEEGSLQLRKLLNPDSHPVQPVTFDVCIDLAQYWIRDALHAARHEKNPEARPRPRLAIGQLMTLAKYWVKSAEFAAKNEVGIVLSYSHGRYEGRSNDHPDDLSRWQAASTIGAGSISISLQSLYEQKRKVGGVSTLGFDALLKSEKPEARIEFNKRVSNALATFAFALLAIPLGITAQRKETSVGFAISLAIGLVYYLLFFLTDLARQHPRYHPELLVWAPNLLFMLVGFYRFYKLTRR